VDTKVARYAERPWHMLIGGELVTGRTGATMPVIHPGDESVIAHIPPGDAADVDDAVAAAQKATKPWARTPIAVSKAHYDRVRGFIEAGLEDPQLELVTGGTAGERPGYLWVNHSSEHIAGTSFGGVKNSGLGREESLEEIESYTQHKNVYIKF
jgi:acyl-CoA reductase-like NAD-dependent aldehyde dehydrogenase